MLQDGSVYRDLLVIKEEIASSGEDSTDLSLSSVEQLERQVFQAVLPKEVELALEQLYQVIPSQQHKQHAMRVSL